MPNLSGAPPPSRLPDGPVDLISTHPTSPSKKHSVIPNARASAGEEPVFAFRRLGAPAQSRWSVMFRGKRSEMWGTRPPASNSASSTASPVPTLRAPTARPNASSKPPCASGLTSATTSTPRSAINNSHPGWSFTTYAGPMVVSVTLRPSAALPWVQRLEGSQVPQNPELQGVQKRWEENGF